MYKGVLDYRYPPEVGVFIGALRKKFKIDYAHYQDRNNVQFGIAEQYLLSNFLVLDPHQFGINTVKEQHKQAVTNPYSHLDVAQNGYTHKAYVKAHRSRLGAGNLKIDRRSILAESLTVPSIWIKLFIIKNVKHDLIARTLWSLADLWGRLVLIVVRQK
jgi:hypothetical protein